MERQVEAERQAEIVKRLRLQAEAHEALLAKHAEVRNASRSAGKIVEVDGQTFMTIPPNNVLGDAVKPKRSHKRKIAIID